MQLTKTLCLLSAAIAPLALAEDAPAPSTTTVTLLRVADLTSSTAAPSSTTIITPSSTATPTPTSTPIWGSSSSVARTPTKSASTPFASNALPHTGGAAASMNPSSGVLGAVVMAAAGFFVL